MSSREESQFDRDQPAVRRSADSQPIDASEDGLLWQAFLYTADELSPDEAERFEALLADDQLAREALSQAVGLGTATKRACEVLHQATPASRIAAPPAPRGVGALVSGKRHAHWVAWVAAAAAACLVVALSLGAWGTFGPEPVESDPADSAAQGELALAWVESAAVLVAAAGEEAAGFTADGSLEMLGPGESEPHQTDVDTTDEADGSEVETDEVEVPGYYSLMAEILSQSPPAEPGDESRES